MMNQKKPEEQLKTSLLEDFYATEADDGESYHITQHVVKAMGSYKTLDVKILELKEDPNNLELLFEIIAMIFQDSEEILKE